MNPQSAVRPNLAAAYLFVKATRRGVPKPLPARTGVLAELARNRFCK